MLFEWSAAGLSTAVFVHHDDDARSGIYEFVRIKAVVAPCAPVVAGILDDRFAPDVDAVKVQDRIVAKVPDDVLIKQRQERFGA